MCDLRETLTYSIACVVCSLDTSRQRQRRRRWKTRCDCHTHTTKHICRLQYSYMNSICTTSCVCVWACTLRFVTCQILKKDKMSVILTQCYAFRSRDKPSNVYIMCISLFVHCIHSQFTFSKHLQNDSIEKSAFCRRSIFAVKSFMRFLASTRAFEKSLFRIPNVSWII